MILEPLARAEGGARVGRCPRGEEPLSRSSLVIRAERLDFRINYYFADNDRFLIGEHKDSSTSSASRVVGRSTSASAPTLGAGGVF